MKKRNLMVFIIPIFLLIIAGCRSNSEESKARESSPENIHSTFILYTEDKNKQEMSTGSLYIKKEENEIEQIANNALEPVVYDNETEQVLYLDKDSNLLKYTGIDEAPEKIDQNVSFMDFSETPDKKVVYYTEDGSVYVYDDSGSVMIGTGVNELELLDDDVYYTDSNYNLIRYNIETREEKRFASDVYQFRLVDGGAGIVYTDADGSLYYLNSVDDSDIAVTSGWVDISSVVKNADELYYTKIEADDSNTLYYVNLADNTRPEIIAENVNSFKFMNDSIIYLTDNSALYQLQGDNVSTRIAMDVSNYDILDNGIVYLDTDNTLYNWNKEEDTVSTVGHDVQSYNYFSNGRVFHLNDKNELFEGNTKIANDINYYSVFFDTLVYANDNTLYMINNENSEEVVLDEDLQNYSAVYYQNQKVYENNLDVADVSGVWKVINPDDETEYIEMKTNGQLTTLVGNMTYNLEEDYKQYNLLSLSSSNNTFEFFYEGDQLVMEVDGIPYTIERSTREEADSYLEEVERATEKAEQEEKLAREKEAEEDRLAEEQGKQEEEKRKAASIVEQFISYMPNAINSGSFYYISDYIDPTSSFYEEQSDFVLDLYKRNIEEELYDYQILDVTLNNDETVTIDTREVFNIYNWDTYEESTSDYNATYNLRKFNNNYYITDLSVK